MGGGFWLRWEKTEGEASWSRGFLANVNEEVSVSGEGPDLEGFVGCREEVFGIRGEGDGGDGRFVGEGVEEFAGPGVPEFDGFVF